MIVFEGVYEENVGFTAPPGPGDYVGSIQASLTRWRRTPRGDIRLTLDGTAYAYSELGGRNRADGGVDLQVRTQMTRRLRGTLGGRLSFGHSDTEGWLVDSAVLLPLVRTLAGDANGGLSLRLGKRTTWSVDGSWRRVDFDSDVFIDTQLWTAGTSLTQRISEREALSMRVQFTRIEDESSTRHEPSASLGFSSQLTRGVSVDLSAGAGRSETVVGVEGEPRSWTALATASLNVVVRRGFVTLRYQHGLRPTPGLGVTELTDLVGLGAVMPIGRRLELVADGSIALRGDARVGAPRRSREADAFAGGALRLARRLRLVLGYRFRYRDNALQDRVIRNNRGSVSLIWGPESLVGNH